MQVQKSYALKVVYLLFMNSIWGWKKRRKALNSSHASWYHYEGNKMAFLPSNSLRTWYEGKASLIEDKHILDESPIVLLENSNNWIEKMK